MRESRALLVTDVVGSTELAARLGDKAMAALWREHDRRARDLMRQWSGREIDKSDGFLLLFERADDAAAYATAYHKALAALPSPLQARAGLHVGEVELRANAADDVAHGAKAVEVEGIAKILAARVMSVANGGQTLATAAACQSLEGRVARSHGHWRMKGLDAPLELFEVGDADMRRAPPAETNKAYRVFRSGDEWLAARDVRNSLPAERDSFVDRRSELMELARLFDAGARLVTLLGLGGSGKTRLALRHARTWLGDFDGGVWFCDLSMTRTASDVVQAVARGLELDLHGSDPLGLTAAAIAGRADCLLVLDNFEQVGAHAEATLGTWLDRAPRARFLATSREPLRIVGEQVLRLDAMPAPDAATLFMHRAAAACAGAVISPADEQAIGPLVELLDGLPLAIELAAARTRVIPPEMLLRRINERFSLLSTTQGRRERQATLRAAFDWSWDLLLQHEREALVQLSVFEGGASLAAVEAVVDGGGATETARPPLDLLQSLVEKSLVRPVGHGRFTLLRTVHDYTRERLVRGARESGDGALRAARARHARYFAGLGPREATSERCIELDNLVAAVRGAIDLGLGAEAVGALKNAWEALRLRGPFGLALELVDRVGAMTDLDDAARISVDTVAGWVWKASGQDARARERIESALQRVGGRDDRAESLLLWLSGDLAVHEGHIDAADRQLGQALVLARRDGEPLVECRALFSLGTVALRRGRHAAAAESYARALAAARRLGDRRLEGGILGTLGLVLDEQGRAAEAMRHYEPALQIARELGDRQWEGNTQCNIGLLLHLQGRNDEARAALQAALEVARDIGHARLESIALCNLALVSEAMCLPDEALPLYEAARDVASRIGDRRAEGQVLACLGALHARQGRFAAAREALAAGEGLLAGIGDRINLALLQCARAEAEHLAGAAVPARDALAAAEVLARELRCEPDSELAGRIATTAALLRSASV
jgi:predicted ATPase/class 3 adenylate cyclase